MVSTRFVLGVPTLGVYTEERRRTSNKRARRKFVTSAIGKGSVYNAEFLWT